MLRFGASHRSFIKARLEARLRLAERGEPGSIAARRSLGLGISIARRIGLVLQRSPALARGRIGECRQGDFLFCRSDAPLFALGRLARRLQFGLDVGEPVLAGEAACGSGRCIRRDTKAVPAPEIPLARYQALAGLEQGEESGSLRAVYEPDLAEPARK